MLLYCVVIEIQQLLMLMSVPHNHRDWLMPLFTVQKLRKIKGSLYSQRDNYVLCESTHEQSAVEKTLLTCEITA